MYASQVLHHYLRPHKSKRDGRHDFADFLMRYDCKGSAKADDDWEDAPTTFSHAGLEYEFANQYENSECTGVSHLVHSWQMQGHQGKEVSLY